MPERGFKINRENEEGQEKIHPNLLTDLEFCLKAVVEIEKQIKGTEVDLKERFALRNNMSNARADLEERRVAPSSDMMENFVKRTVSGFQGLGGFDRYIVYGNGGMGLLRSHSIGPCVRKAQELNIETPEF